MERGAILNSLVNAIKRLNFVKRLPESFDQEERRLVIQAVVIGIVVWAAVFSLKSLVHWLFETTLHWLEGVNLLFVFVPLLLGALLTAVIIQYKATTIYYRDSEGHIHQLVDAEGDGLERAIALYYTSEPTFEQALTGQEGVEVRWQMPTLTLAVRKFLATLTTIGSGGSGGLEASVTLIGESLSAGLFKPRRIVAEADKHVGLVGRFWNWWQTGDPDDLQTAQLGGIAAAVSVLLGAPFAAAFFATEVMYRNRPIIEKLVYSLISSLVAFFLNEIFTGGSSAIFDVESLFVPPTNLGYYGVLVLVATVISLVSVLFGRLRTFFEQAFHTRQPIPWRRHLLGAACTAVVAIIVTYSAEYFELTEHGLELVLGPGEEAIHMALAGELTMIVALIALLAKMVATLTTIGSGGSAGLLVPSLFFGTMVASAFAHLFGYEPQMLIVPAMTATLVAIVNVPLAAILFAVEVFGSVYMVPALIMLIVTSILAHDRTIYRPQREYYARRQILPGASVRRIPIPAKWAGQTLIDLDFRKRFNLNVIGLVEKEAEDGLPHVRLGSAATVVLEAGDILVVLGRDEHLDALETAVKEEQESNPVPSVDSRQALNVASGEADTWRSND